MTKQPSAATSRTLAEAEREHILEVLKQTDWLIGGRDGAATRLGLPRTTLVYRMRKLGIERGRSHRARSVQHQHNGEPPVFASASPGGLPASRFAAVSNL
jgi:Bacterial regulatory protein, Fis family